MAHPHRIAAADLPDAVIERRGLLHLDLGAAEFAVMAALDLAAELLGHRLLAVADAEYRHAGLVDRLRRQRRAFFVYRSGAAGEDHGLGLVAFQGGFGAVEGNDLAVDARLAHAPGDQLRDLGAEIDDQNLVVRRGHCRASRASLRSCRGSARFPHQPFKSARIITSRFSGFERANSRPSMTALAAPAASALGAKSNAPGISATRPRLPTLPSL